MAGFFIAIAAVMPLWSQVEPSATGGGIDLDSEHMKTPPPVSREGYPTSAASGERSNFLAGGLVFTAAGTDNVLFSGSEKTPDATYALVPTIELDRKTPKSGESLSYNSGFTFYQIYSQLNAVTQSGSGSYRLNLSPYTVVRLSDSFSQNHNSYNQGNPFTPGSAPGTPGSPDVPIIEPYAGQLTNSSSAAVEYQYAKNAMIGASGSYSFLQYSGSSFTPLLSNQNTTTGDAFYSRRFGRSYAGVTYEFTKYITHPFQSYTLSNTVFGFYTHYFSSTFSISVLGGPQNYKYQTESIPEKSSAWTPAVQASIGWQVRRANLAASYAHLVSGAGGLIGTFHSDTGSFNCQFLLSRLWSTGGTASFSHYANINSTTSGLPYNTGGNTVYAGIDLRRKINESLSMEAGYQHLYLSYPGITNTNSLANSNRGYISVSYHFNRSLGR